MDDPTGPEFWLSVVTVGVANTVSDAVLLVAPVPPSVEVIVLVVLLIVPAAVPVTLMLNVHDPPAPTVPPDKLTEVEPATAVAVPLQVLASAFGVATTRPPVNVSVKLTPVIEVEPLGLLIMKVSEVDALITIAPEPNALLIVGGPTTVTVAVLLTAPAPLCVEEIAPVVFTLAPTVVPVTFTLI